METLKQDPANLWLQ